MPDSDKSLSEHLSACGEVLYVGKMKQEMEYIVSTIKYCGTTQEALCEAISKTCNESRKVNFSAAYDAVNSMLKDSTASLYFVQFYFAASVANELKNLSLAKRILLDLKKILPADSQQKDSNEKLVRKMEDAIFKSLNLNGRDKPLDLVATQELIDHNMAAQKKMLHSLIKKLSNSKPFVVDIAINSYVNNLGHYLGLPEHVLDDTQRNLRS